MATDTQVTTLQELFNDVGMYMAFPDESARTEWYAKVDSLSGNTGVAAAPVVIPAVINPVTGAVMTPAQTVDPITGAVISGEVTSAATPAGAVVTPITGDVIDPNTGAVITHATAPGAVIDPATGQPIPTDAIPQGQ